MAQRYGNLILLARKSQIIFEDYPDLYQMPKKTPVYPTPIYIK